MGLTIQGLQQANPSSPRNQGPPPPLNTTKPVSYSPCSVHSVPEFNPHVALHGVWCPPAPGYEYIWLINYCQSQLTSVRCQVSGHAHTPRMGISPSPTQWRRDNQNRCPRTSLVAQWLRIHLPMQGTWIWAVVREDPTCRRATKPVRRNYWACALEPASHNYWSPRHNHWILHA